ncbi:helix-turn-helix domain-containing protein [Lentzea tibetensis]|uniref:Helix-turn-helix domain-containing protein n=1 Tax=Lentzea tibetensis TaxID=2591470 RepID=A0A563EEZ3_9PSEU|nr:helix-turn-helix transcriptional regulator [Lentzea tibetensis]TWP43983.1 helix-turn-helix domain-containing protein [Lentzea tibetensis]
MFRPPDSDFRSCENNPHSNGALHVRCAYRKLAAMTPTPSTPYSRDLGDELRHLREKHTTYTGTEMGYVLGWHQTKVSNVENGKVRASEIDIVQYLTTCKRSRAFVEGFLNRYRHAFDAYFVQVPENLRTIAISESPATKITSISTATVPGLLQTEPYTRMILKSGGRASPDQIGRLVEARMARQAILRRHDRPDCLFYVHENALQLNVGDDAVMAEQMQRLMFNTHTIRIVPKSSGPAGVVLADYVQWEYDKDRPVVYSENELTRVFAHDSTAIARYAAILERLASVALDEGQSRSLLMNYSGRHSRPREDPDASGHGVA